MGAPGSSGCRSWHPCCLSVHLSGHLVLSCWAICFPTFCWVAAELRVREVRLWPETSHLEALESSSIKWGQYCLHMVGLNKQVMPSPVPGTQQVINASSVLHLLWLITNCRKSWWTSQPGSLPAFCYLFEIINILIKPNPLLASSRLSA